MREKETNDSTYESKFYSADYSSGQYAPQLIVNYDPSPTASVSVDSSVHTWGDTATICEKANTFYPNDVQWLETGFNLGSSASNSTNWRGVIGWFRTSSLVPSANWQTDGSLPGGSVIAHTTLSGYGNNMISVNLAGCSSGSITGTSKAPGDYRCSFAITIGQNYGAMPMVTPDTRFGMSPSGAATWGLGGVAGNYFSGDLPSSPTSQGWAAQPGAGFAVVSEAVNTLTYTHTASDYYNSANGPDNVNNQGRGAATLMWPKVSGASGYHIYLNDGSGTYRQVGTTLGGGSVLWSSAGDAFYPGDSEIAALSNPANAYYRAATPTDGSSQLSGYTTPSTLQATVTPSPAPSPTASPGAGVVLSDGTYLYEHAWAGYGGPTKWTRIDATGTHGYALGYDYGPIAYSPDLSTIGGVGASGFYENGYLYNGAATSATTIDGVSTSTGATSTFTFSKAPLDRNYGTQITGAATSILLCGDTDAESATHVYSIAYTLTRSNGNPNLDGYRIYEYDGSGNFVAEHDLGVSSEYIDGALADGGFLYLIAWNGGSSSAHITKISTTTWQIVDQFSINQASTHAINGCYDSTNDCFWLGALDQNRIYKYAGSGGTTNPGFDLRDNPNPLYQATAGGSQYADWTAYDFKVVPFTNSGGPSNNAISAEATPSPVAAYEVAATLDNRTYSSSEDRSTPQPIWVAGTTTTSRHGLISARCRSMPPTLRSTPTARRRR